MHKHWQHGWQHTDSKCCHKRTTCTCMTGLTCSMMAQDRCIRQQLLYDSTSAGGLGFADVAVTCLPQAASDSQASAQTLAQQQPPLSPNLTWQELQGHSASPNSSPEQKKNKLLGSAFGAAANVLKAIGNPAKGEFGNSIKQVCLHLCCLLTCCRLVGTGDNTNRLNFRFSAL